MEKQDSYRFKKEIDKRNITCLVHFTPTINLLSILEKGFIYSRKRLEELSISVPELKDYVEFTDKIRFDDKNYINTSIEFPNSELFKRFRRKDSDLPFIDWCVIKISKHYIYDSETLFSVTNAANSYNRNSIGIEGSYEKFLQMYSPSLEICSHWGQKHISRENLKNSFTTDVQAEVLIKNDIPIRDIIEVCFNSQESLEKTKVALSYFCKSLPNMKVREELFLDRSLIC